MGSKFFIPHLLLVSLVGCSPAVQPHDPVSVVRAEIEAINKGQVDRAASYFSDDAQVISTVGQPQGKEKIKAWIRVTVVGWKSKFDATELSSNGMNVSGPLVWSEAGGALPFILKAVVKDGKITYWELGNKPQ